MEQQLQKLTQAILARGKLLKQLEVQCAAIQASVEEMKPKPVTPPAQASSSRSLAAGELDAPMLTGCSMKCPNDDTDSRTSTFMPDEAPGPPSTTALLDVAITSPEPTDATILVREGTGELTPTPSGAAVHPIDLGDEHVPNLSYCQLGARKVFDRMCGTDGVPYGFSTNGLVLTTCCPDESSTAGIAVVDRATCRRERAHRVLILARLENLCGAMEFRQPWPPPTQEDVACSGVELGPMSWLSCKDYRDGVKWMPPWSPPLPGRMLILEKGSCPTTNSTEMMCSILNDALHMVPLHAFGFGVEHDSDSLHSIAKASSGTFSFFEDEVVMQDVFAQCIGGLLSVVVQEMQFNKKCVCPGVQLRSIKSDSYQSKVTRDGRNSSVVIGHLYADEERDILLSVNIPQCREKTSLLKVACAYIDPVTNETIKIQGDEVKINRLTSTISEPVSIGVEFIWIGGQFLSIPLDKSINICSQQSAIFSATNFLWWGSNIFWSLKKYENVKKKRACFMGWRSYATSVQEICTNLSGDFNA